MNVDEWNTTLPEVLLTAEELSELENSLGIRFPESPVVPPNGIQLRKSSRPF
jgi:hypothetical protein